MSEIWKEVPGYEGLYEVNNLGNVKKSRSGRLLKPQNSKKGYLHVVLCRNGKEKGFRIHRLVYSAFHGEIPAGFEVNHINEDKADNRLENLNLMSHKENINWGTGVRRSAKSRKGKTYNGKRVAQVDREYTLIKIHDSLKNASVETGAFVSNISTCCKRKDKTAKGFHWVIVPADCQDVESFIYNHYN